jgi:hypothetical protein
MIRMLIVGYVFAIRSERQLCAEVQVNLAYRWFCKLGIEDKIPDHSVFCRARHERLRESDALRRVFEGVVAMCMAVPTTAMNTSKSSEFMNHTVGEGSCSGFPEFATTIRSIPEQRGDYRMRGLVLEISSPHAASLSRAHRVNV